LVEFTGERVIPGQVDDDLLNEHLARYAFAVRLASGKRVLDAGCGAGYGSAELVKSALSVTGVDIAAEAVGFAREHYRLPNLHFEQASCTALPHRNAAFDLVVAFEVIEHLPDWRAFLVEVRRVLTPGGHFIVSTPNKRYYAESRARAGPNPFHAHEFDFAEFRTELESIFPHISLFLENHAEGVVFRPLDAGAAAEVRVDGGDPPPDESHFFLAVCAHSPQTAIATFVYVPKAGNVLRERETHIALLEAELRQKNTWLDETRQSLAQLDQKHRGLQAELEESNRWAQRLNTELDKASAAIAELDRENLTKTEWAERLDAELEAKARELAQCVEYLHTSEKTVEERTRWAQQLDAEVQQLRARLSLVEASRWVRLGRRVGLGPAAPSQ